MAELTAFTPTIQSYDMAGTLVIINRNRVKRIREAVLRYCQKVLGDSDPIIEITSDEETDKFVVTVASPKFASMPYSTRLNSILDFLFADPEASKDDLFEISRIMPVSE